MTTTAKYLIQTFPEKGIGRIFLWTPLLAKRDDMKPYDGVPPKSMRVSLVGAQPEAERPIAAFKTSVEDAGKTVDTSLSPVPLSAVPRAAAAVTKAVDGVKAGTDAGANTDAGVGKEPETQGSPAGESDGNITEGQDLTPSFTPEQKHARLVEIIGTWNPDDFEHFTTAGLPRLDSLMKALGADVEGTERDAAWEAFCAHHATSSGQNSRQPRISTIPTETSIAGAK